MTKQSKRKASAKKVQAIQTSRHLGVAAHRHTGRVTPRRTTSYPVLMMILLVTGVLLASWTQMVAAGPFVFPGPVTNSYDVHLRVPGPPPTEAASIDSPVNGTVFTDVPVTVNGHCPLNTYVELLRNNYSSGVAMCQADGTYQLRTDLFSGANKLIARVHSLTDVPGPDSTSVTVTYKPPAPPSSSTGGSSSTSSEGYVSGGTQSSSSSLPPFLIKSSFAFQGYYVGDWARWQVEVSGGVGPYALAVDWGDGTHDLYSRAVGGPMVLEHIYHKSGGYKGSYTIQITGSDNAGQHSFLQLITIVNNPPSAAGASHSGSSYTNLPNGISWLAHGNLGRAMKYAWPTYGLVVLMLLCFWLGERRERQLLRPHIRRHRHA